MSQPNRRRNGLKLPLTLLQELGISGDAARGGSGRRRYGEGANRQDSRRAQRVEKTTPRGRNTDRHSTQHDRLEDRDEEDGPEESDSVRATESSQTAKATFKPKTAPKPAPRSILKQLMPRPTSPDFDLSEESRASSPGLVLDASSRAFQDRAAQDDDEIANLEKRLGLKKKKQSTTKSGDVDGFEDLLEGLDEDEDDDGRTKRKRQGEEWLQQKRRRTQEFDDEDDEDESEEDGAMRGSDLSMADSDSDETEALMDDEKLGISVALNSASQAGDTFTGFESDEDHVEVQPAQRRVRENPYVAPPTSAAAVTKYVPPSLRLAQEIKGPSSERLRRQLQGHLNKLSEANLVSILGEIEKVYQSNARQEVTSLLIDLLLSLFCSTSSLSNTFVILHAAFTAAVYKVIGIDFGAEVVSKLVERFNEYHNNRSPGKESLNLVSLLSSLFIFNVISSTLVFNHIRLLLEKLTESNTELLLRIIRDCGPQLRQDDPTSLKSIVQMTQTAAARLMAEGEDMSVRTKFMIETITDLKNNKMRASTNAAGLASEHITQMRKALGSLNNRTIRASEPLRISRNDLEASDRKGKWWLVGASWKGDASHRVDEDPSLQQTAPNGNTSEADDGASDLLALARQYRMNTDIRRSIFIAIMSANDYQDAHMRLTRLRLKRAQEQEIPRVLLRCAGAEAAYNPYYTLIAKRLCSDKRIKMAFQFGLWDFYKRLGEKADDESDDDGEEEVEMSEIVNFARLYAHLIMAGSLTLGVLKTLNLLYLKDQTRIFVELLLVTILREDDTGSNHNTDDEEDRLARIFGRAADTPQIIKGLRYFVKTHVKKSDLVGKKDRARLKENCAIVDDVLAMVETNGLA